MDPQTQKDEEQDVFRTQYFDPFPQPQTIPAGWDTSAILSAPKPAPVMDEEDSTES